MEHPAIIQSKLARETVIPSDQRSLKASSRARAARLWGLAIVGMAHSLSFAAAPGAAGDAYVARTFSNNVGQYDGTTGAPAGTFVATGSGGLSQPLEIIFGPNGRFYASSSNTNNVLEYDGSTGAFIRTFATGSNLVRPFGISFGPNGNLFVSSESTDRVIQYHGTTGAFVSTFIPTPPGGFFTPRDLAFGPNGNLFVGNTDTGTVQQFHGVTGALIGTFTSGTQPQLPEGIVFGPDGRLYVADSPNARILEYHATTGAFLRSLTSAGMSAPQGIDFGGDGRLYVVASQAAAIYRFDIPSGVGATFTLDFPNLFFAWGIAMKAPMVDCNSNGLQDSADLLSGFSDDCNTNDIPDECDIDDGTSHDCDSNDVPDECEDDCNTNGYRDSCDIAGPTSADCNGNSDPDECDLLSGASQDCDGSDVPDECELDCNGNGYHDSCDISDMTSQDCDGSTVPDECEQDCNTNGYHDSCDIAGMTSEDCNTNSAPDECDIAGSTSLDANTNSVPDECDTQPGLYLIYGNNGRAQEDCVQPGSGTNETLTVHVDMRGAPTPITGGQFFIEYDYTKLDFVTMTPGDMPFTREVFESIDEPNGAITYAVGIQDTGTATQADTTMAVITFIATTEDCATTILVRFVDAGSDFPPTRLSDNNDGEVQAQQIDLPAITLDFTIPEILDLEVGGGSVDGACEATVTFSAFVLDNCGIQTADVGADVVITTGNALLGAPVVTRTQVDALTVLVTGSVLVSAVENCPATVQVTIEATDDCGNEAVPAVDSADVNDATAPQVTSLIVTGADAQGSCETIVTFSAVIEDNCFLDTADVSVAVSIPLMNGTLGTPTITMTQVDGQTVSLTGSVAISAIQSCPVTVEVSVDAIDDCNNPAATATDSADVNEVTPPEINDLFVTGGNVDGSCQYLVTFSANVTDNCAIATADVDVDVSLTTANAVFAAPIVTLTQVNSQTVEITGSVLVSDVENCPATVQVTIDAIDGLCGNVATPVSGSGDVLDATEPVISSLAVTGGTVDANCEYTVTFGAVITDNCFVDAADVLVDVALTTGNAALGAPTINLDQTDGRTVTLTGSVLVSDLTSCPATVEVTVDASDDCFNAASQQQASSDVHDEISPVTTAPADISVHADAGTCEAAFSTLPMATATDNCDTGLTITFVRSDGKLNLLDPYENADSPITITWQSEDDCGNTSTDTQVITVSDQNEITVDVELSPTIDDTNGPLSGSTLQRCITFNLWQCPADLSPTSTIAQEIIFPTDAGSPARATNVSVLTPCGFAYTCMTARDRLHTLRSTAPDFSDAGTTYRATFIGNRATGGHSLLGGNLNDDAFIDILDFASFVIQFQTFYGTGDTDCATPFFHPDISGDGLIFTSDFTFIQINILKLHEPNCCGRPGLDDSSAAASRRASGEIAPIMSISIPDLWRHGLGDLAAADLNGDGLLDVADMQLFTQWQGLPPVVLPAQGSQKVSPSSRPSK